MNNAREALEQHFEMLADQGEVPPKATTIDDLVLASSDYKDRSHFLQVAAVHELERGA